MQTSLVSVRILQQMRILIIRSPQPIGSVDVLIYDTVHVIDIHERCFLLLFFAK